MSSAGIAVSPIREHEVLSPIRYERSRSLHYLEDSILIYLAVPGSSMIPIRVLDSDSIACVKLRIQSCKGFVVKKQKLVFDGHELARNNCLVRDYGVTDGNILHLVIRLSDLQSISVKTACGKKFDFQVERTRSVAYIKEYIAKKAKEFVDIDAQKLICDGEELDDHQLINDICKNDDAVIHLLIRKIAKVRTRYIDRDFELSVDAPCLEEKNLAGDLNVVATESPSPRIWIEPVIVNPKIELSPVLRELIQSTSSGLENKNNPVMSSEGSGGAYFMQDGAGRRYVAVFKPIDEEPMAENNPRGLPLSLDGQGLKRGTRVGEGALREVAAYILDHPTSGPRCFFSDEVGFSGVPPTVMVRCLHSGSGKKDLKIGSLQMFVKNYGSCEDFGPQAFPVEEVHKIAVLDLRLANADRHAGNILVCREGEEGRFVLVPIDHGYCLPENFEDCTFDWLFWPQSREPFDSRTLDYINSLDADQDLSLLKFHGWEPSLECSRTLCISTMLLKKGAARGLTPFDIGNILCRETVKKDSKIEEMVREAAGSVLPGTSETAFLEAISEIMDDYLDTLKQ
ncbi:putative phosphatidylinositol 4-kinase type 2-beta [Apostasia shenzhenica]|uniref:1-phosphatidylinositol 4-kinase n=1 Tax=Apostasia shenzhenica TaxID=1088818 RepID=A0A2I0B825_9ASPA|nr:putative phosphatidylinositol 4-kinase type 2-beta [Apostasia shenzhenica]